MKYFIISFLFGSVGLISACTETHSGPPALDRQHYTFNGPTHCDSTTNEGVDVSVSYVLLKENTEGARKINDSLRSLAVNSVVSWLDSATVAGNPNARTNLSQAVNLFASDYESMLEDMGNLGGCWNLKTTADTVHASPKVVTVKYETYATQAVLTRILTWLFTPSIWKLAGC